MPNNGIISKFANLPEKFKVNTTTGFVNTEDTVVVNKALNGTKVEQKAVTLNQLAGMVGGGSQGPQGPIGPEGPVGPPGPAAPAGLNWQGAWEQGNDYYLNDVATYTNPVTGILGSYWVTAESVTDDTTPVDSEGNVNTGWAFLASQGPQGPAGATGPAGPQGAVGPQGPAGSSNLNYQSVLVFLQFQSDAFFTTPIVNEWGTFTTSTILGSGNANCQFVFDTPFTNKIAVVQFSSADTNISSRKWYSYETVDGSTIDINVGMGTTSSTQAVTAGNLTGMKAVVEFRFYNS